jgi:hypothetical protein
MRGMVGWLFLGLVVLAAVFVITYVLASLWISTWVPLKRRRLEVYQATKWCLSGGRGGELDGTRSTMSRSSTCASA